MATFIKLTPRGEQEIAYVNLDNVLYVRSSNDGIMVTFNFTASEKREPVRKFYQESLDKFRTILDKT